MRIEPASHGQVDEIAALLSGHALPTAGLSDQFPVGYAVATELSVIVGCAGLETYGNVGLLRSLAVSKHHQSSGIGRALVANRVDAAKVKRLDALYLLTTTARDYFLRLGFAPADRAQVPARVATSPEFASACPASASCLSLAL
jgi:amino-acid N-acetyltransferase